MYVFTNCVCVILCMQTISGLKEPECSRYHYEEQMLERVVRMGMEFDNQKNEVKDVLGTVTEKLESFLNDLKVIKRDNEELTNKLNEEVKDIVGTVAEQLEGFSNGVQVIKRENEELKNNLKNEVQVSISDLEKVKEKVFLPFVFFHAQTVADITPKHGSSIVFTETLENAGKGYDNTTGIFTAPEDGIYLVSFHLCIKSGQQLYYGLVIDGKDSLRGEMYEQLTRSCNSVQRLLTLSADNRVWIKVYVQDVIMYQSINHVNTFSAVLLNKGQ